MKASQMGTEGTLGSSGTLCEGEEKNEVLPREEGWGVQLSGSVLS